MICSQCKNEKWDQDICPVCGLSEKEALLTKAENLRRDGRNLPAVESYKKYLQLQPGQKDALQKMAGCLCSEAISCLDLSIFTKADKALLQALEEDWEWEPGHQFRVDLYFHFGKLEALLQDYEKTSLKDESRKEICEKIIRIILLTKKFKENPPEGSTSLTQNEGFGIWPKNSWLFLLLLFFLWVTYEVAVLSSGENEKRQFFLLLVFMVLGFVVLVLFFLNINQHRKSGEKRMRVKK